MTRRNALSLAAGMRNDYDAVSSYDIIRDKETELLSSGAVWLDEPVETRDEGIDKLQNLIVTNMDQARPAIRQHLGLPPLPQN